MNHKKKILFIEDEPDQITIVCMRLEKSGFAALSADTGEEGLRLAIQEKPDLILLDIIMPGMDGFEVCRKLRSNPVTKKIPIIATTAAGLEDLEQRCLNAGADECVRKPYDSTNLLNRIEHLLKK